MNAPTIELTNSVVKDLTGLGIDQDNIRYYEKEDKRGRVLLAMEVVYITRIIAN